MNLVYYKLIMNTTPVFLMNIEQMIPHKEILLKSLSNVRKRKIEYLEGDEKMLSIALGILINKVLCCDEDKHIFYSESGQPKLINSNQYISFTHGGKYAALAYARMPIGIDIEPIKSVNLQVAKHYFTSEEQDWIYAGDTTRRFLELWTKKESIAKIEGRGLTIPLSEISVLENTSFQTDCCIIDQHVLSCASNIPFKMNVKVVTI